MKLLDFKENQALRSVLLALTIILGFIFIVSFSVIYVSDAIKNNNACGCVIPIPYMILILSSLGLFIGSFSFYILISKHLKDRKEMSKNMDLTLNFLDDDEKKIMKYLIDSKGESKQSELEKTKLSRVKVHRIIQKIERKGLIIKQSRGKINMIKLNEDLKDIFCS